ncbi:MAG: DUF4956 domain-containing protein [Saprospiraceae bacterium]|jgi:hypothetical protein|nr:DUF4956 domain-containing protein [Saprospiraceae bacterium]
MEFLTAVSLVDNQSVVLIVFSALLSFLLATLIVFTYEKTSQEVAPPHHFIQSMILMAIVTSTIMQSIGDSMARGFGIFGALAILRFRTNLISTRNISFIFASMAVGIACGVYSFVNAIIGTLAFCLIAFLLRLTPFSRKSNLLGQLRFTLPADSTDLEPVQQAIGEFCRAFALKRYRVLSGPAEVEQVEYWYEIRMTDEMQGVALAHRLREYAALKDLRLNFNDTYINLTD